MQLNDKAVDPESEALCALLRRMQHGDEGALIELQRSMGRRIYAFVLHRCNDPHEAESIVTDTLYEIWKAPGRYRGESRPSSWMLGIARNRMLMALRSRRAHGHEDIDDHADTVACPLPLPVEQLSRQEHRQILHRCMDALSPNHREAIHLVYFEGLDLASAAALQAIPENTVKTRLFHARSRLKACLAEHAVVTGAVE